VDIAEDMLLVARSKAEAMGFNIQWILHDITRLDEITTPVLLELLPARKKFDAILCVSALVLLPDPPAALKHWARFLNPGGKIVTDVPLEDAFPGARVLFKMSEEGLLGKNSVFLRHWYPGKKEFTSALEDAGLKPRILISRKYQEQTQMVTEAADWFDQLSADRYF
jgi:SAM-dependent methyltransferase